jgi:tetratricopeptide (TPR) repeat protein
MSEQSSDPDPLLPLAEEFAERYRRGEHPSLTEYAEKHPELAERIRRLFPTLVVMEEFGSVAGAPTGPFAVVAGSAPQRLGEYRLLHEMGRGGMGVVYEAVQESLGRHVALKVLTAHGLLSPTQLQRFDREAKAAARLHHTNIVPVYGVGEAEGVHYYAMQFIPGRSVDGVLRELRRLRHVPDAGHLDELTRPETPAPGEEPEAVTRNEAPAAASPSGLSELSGRSDVEYFRSVARVGVQAAEALAHAHAQGVLHRDIKPANLLIDTQGNVWVTDFGLAKLEGSDDLTREGEVPGTLRYMAPERFAGHADARSDTYSLGLTLYELLTLRPAFVAGDRAALFEQILHADPPRPRTLDPHVPRDLEAVILKAIAKEPAERYPTAQEMADDLRRFLDDMPIHARRSTVTLRVRKWMRRHRAVVVTAAVGFIAAVAVAAGGVGWVLSEEAAQRSRSGDEARQAVEELEAVRGERRWPQAIELARRAERLLSSGRGDPEQLRRVRELLRDLQMAQDLEETRAQEGDAFDFGPVDQHYAQAFQRFGIDVEELDPADAAGRIRERSVSVELAAALDYWALRRRDHTSDGEDEKWQRLARVAQLADPDERRQQVRDALLNKDEETLKQLAEDPKSLELPPSTLDLLGKALRALDGPEAAATFLHAAQLRHPDDFWLNHGLASCLADIPERGESVRFYTVAVGLRPRSPVAWINLGAALHEGDYTDDAIVALHEAIRLDTERAAAHNNLGNALVHKGDYDGAIAAFEKAAALEPQYATPHVNLGNILTKRGDFDRAVAECKTAIRLEPLLIEAHGNLGLALAHKGELEEAVAAHRRAIALAEKRMARIPRYQLQVAVQLNNLAIVFPDDTRSETEQALRRALEICRSLERKDPRRAEYRGALGMTYNNLGLVLRRKGKLAEAEAALREAVRYHELTVEIAPTREHTSWLAGSYFSLALLLSAEGRRDEAEKLVEQGIQLLRPLVRDYPNVTAFKENLAKAHFNQGLLLEFARPADAEREFGEAAKLYQELADSHPGVPQFSEGLGTSYNSLGRVLSRDGGRAAAAEQALCEAHKHLEPLADRYRGVPAYRKSLAVNCSNLALLLEKDPRRAAEADPLFGKCLDLYEGLVSDFPTVPDYKSGLAGALHNRALDLSKRKQFADARKDMERAVQLQRDALDATDGRQPRYRELLRDHYNGLTGILLDDGDHAGAAEVAENLPRLFPDGWEEYVRAVPLLANCAVLVEKDTKLSPEERKRRYSAHVGRINELLATAAQHIAAADPKTTEARQYFAAGSVKVGTYYANSHEWALARQSFEKAIELQPTFAEAYCKLGDMLVFQRQLPEAAGVFRQAVAHSPDCAEAHDGLAKVLDTLGKTEAALAAYRKASKLYTDKAKAARVQVNLGACLARNGRLPEAEKEFRRAIELQPERADAHYGLGRVLGDQNKNQEAITEFRTATEIQPDYAEAYECLAMTLAGEAKRFVEDAVAAYRKASKLYTNKADAARVQINLGTCLARNGQLPEAEKEFRRAIELQPKSAEASYNLGLALGQQGKTKDAITSFRTAVEIKPDYAAAWGNLGFALHKDKQFGEALKALTESRRLLPADDPAQPKIEALIRDCERLAEPGKE